MDTISKNKSLISIIIFLLITNLAMLFFFLVLNNQGQRNHGHDQNGISSVLQKDVGFTKAQLDSYLSLRKDQVDKLHTLFDELRKAKTDFYDLIYIPQVSDSSVNRAADLIAEKQKTLDLQMFNHLERVRNICTPDQLQKFDTTIKKVIIRMTSRPGRDR